MLVLSNKGKPSRSSDRKYMRNIVPLFLGMLICISCLAGVTWAWFTANSTASVQRIQSAEYSVAVEVNEASTDTPIEVNVEDNVASCTLTPNTSYSVTLTPDGTATKGYCLITDGDKVYTTGQLLVDTTFTFTYNNGLENKFESAQEYDKLIDNTSDRNFAIAWYWGEYPNTLSQMTFSMEEPILLENGSVIGQPIAERPEEYATLSLQLTDMTADMESGELAVDTDCVITFTADDGYTLPESIAVDGVETYSLIKSFLVFTYFICWVTSPQLSHSIHPSVSSKSRDLLIVPQIGHFTSTAFKQNISYRVRLFVLESLNDVTSHTLYLKTPHLNNFSRILCFILIGEKIAFIILVIASIAFQRVLIIRIKRNDYIPFRCRAITLNHKQIIFFDTSIDHRITFGTKDIEISFAKHGNR